MKTWEAQAIKAHCTQCAGSRKQAKICEVRSCDLWPLLPDWHRARRKKAEKEADGVQTRMVIRKTTIVEIK